MAQKRRLTVHHVLPGLLLAFTLCVFAPVDLYCSNADEFWFSLGDLLPGLLLAALGVFLLVTAAAVFLPARASVAFRAVVYAVSFMAYLQGNLLLIDYGTLNGAEIDWSAYTLRYILNILLWIVVIALFIILLFRFRKKFRRILEVTACVLLITEVFSLGYILIRQNTDGKTDYYLSAKGQFTVSREKNTVVFVLDTVDSHLFENMRNTHGEIAEWFEDFTFYPDTVGGATRTMYAIPYIFIGDTNREDRSYTEYLKAGFASSPVIREMAAGDYDTGIYSISHYIDCSRSDAIDNAARGRVVPSSRLDLTKQFMKLVAFRYVPSVFSRCFWMYSGDFEYLKSDLSEAPYAMDDVRFYDELTEKGLSATSETPVFRFYHLQGAHGPYTMNRNCKRVNNGESDEEEQALGTFRIVAEYLGQLKAAGLYDRTDVVVMADHGFGAYSCVEQTPLFMVKTRDERHPFAVSDQPIHYSMMPELFTSLLLG